MLININTEFGTRILRIHFLIDPDNAAADEADGDNLVPNSL